MKLGFELITPGKACFMPKAYLTSLNVWDEFSWATQVWRAIERCSAGQNYKQRRTLVGERWSLIFINGIDTFTEFLPYYKNYNIINLIYGIKKKSFANYRINLNFS